MPAALNAIELLNQATTAAGDDDTPMHNKKEDEVDDQHYLGALADGIKFLHTMVVNNKLNLEQVAFIETSADVISTAALSSCQRHPSSRDSNTRSTILTLVDCCILILTKLICQGGTSTTQVVSVAENIYNLTLLAIKDTAADSVRPIAIRSLTLTLSKLWSVEGDEATVQIVKKISLAAIHMVRDCLEHCKKKDDPVVRHSLDLLVAVAAVPAASEVVVQECCGETISAIEDVAQQALELQTQSNALRAMYVLLRKGCNPQHVSEAASSWLPLLLATWRGYTTSKSEQQQQQQSTMMNAVALQAFGAALLACIPFTSTNATDLLSAITATCCLLEQCYPLLIPGGSTATPTSTSNMFSASLPGDVFNGTIGQLHQQSLHAAFIPIITDAVLDGLRQLLSLVSNNDMHDHNSEVDIHAPDKDGYTLLHRLAAAGMQPCLQLLVSSSGPLDILARTLTGANALQLAREGKHMSCVVLLEPLTEVAAAARQEALLRELEEFNDKAEGNNSSKKTSNKKKKSITRSASFFTEQPDEKTQKLDDNNEKDDVKEADERQRMTDERLRREEEYEKALEQRRRELEAMNEEDQQQQMVATLPASDKDPETPDNMSIAQPDGGITTTSSSNDGLHDCSSSDEAPPAAVFEPGQVQQQHQQQLQGDGPAKMENAVPRNASMTSLDIDFSALTARLQDALFVHDDDGSLPPHFASAARGDDVAGMTPLLMKKDEAALQQTQTLFASLRGVSVGDNNGHSSFFPVPSEETDPYSLLGVAPPTTSQSNLSHHGSGAAAVLSSLGATHPHHQQLSACMNGDECSDPTRHLWIGNLSTLTPRPLLKATFARFGILDDVVTFPGRMYAFVNYRTTLEAMHAFSALHDVCVPELTGDKQMLIKYRPVKKAAAHLRALGLADEDGGPLIMATGGLIGPAAAAAAAAAAAFGGVNVSGGNIDVENLGQSLGLHRSTNVDKRQRSSAELDRDGNSSAPSPRIWLGNIAANARNESLHAVLSRYGPLTDAAVFPARIGPLGYAFVKFERLDDAKSAVDALNNTVVPLLSGSKQLKMRYKPANDGPPGREPGALDPSHTIPSRHLWLGNVTQKPTEEVIGAIFSEYGTIDSVRVFPIKAFAFVNFTDILAAVRAVTSLEGRSIMCLTGVKPLVMRYQHDVSPMQTTTTAATSSASITTTATSFPPPSQQLGGAMLGTASPSMTHSQLSLPSILDLSNMSGGDGSPSPATVPSLMKPPPLSHTSSNASMLMMPPPSHTSSDASMLMASPNNKDALWVGGNNRNYNTTNASNTSLFGSNSSGGYGFDAQTDASERMMTQDQHAANMMNMSLPPSYGQYEHDAPAAAAAATQSQLNSLLTNLTALQYSVAISKPPQQQANTNNNNEMQMQQLLATLLAQQQQQPQAPNAPWMNGWS